ncbi:MAG: hypothetical protein R2828_21690 [Saprospiraceae bacterium]
MDFRNLETLKTVVIHQVDEQLYTATYEGRMFSIGVLLFQSLQMLEQNIHLDQIATRISAQHEIQLSGEQLMVYLNQFVDIIEVDEKQDSTLTSYVYWKVKMMGERPIQLIANTMAPLFHKYVLALLLPLSTYITVWFMGQLYYSGQLLQDRSIGDSVLAILLTYAGLIGLAFFHEFGHASAAAYYKKPSDSIGFGFYLVFPVFFTDVTSIWNLNRWKRIVVNIGGIYFQLLSNMLLAGAFLLTANQEVQIIFKYFFIANLVYIFYSLNPFLRNDGYWVYSDLFRLPNLTQRARRYPLQLLQRIFDQKAYTLKGTYLRFIKEFPLLIYSFGYVLVMGLIVLALAWLTIKNVGELSAIGSKISAFGWGYISEDWARIGKLCFGLFINIFFLSRMIKHFIIRPYLQRR